MSLYIWNKIISIGIPLVVIGLVSIVMTVPQSWTTLLVGISLLGYTHYLLGAYYQQLAWIKRKRYRRFLCWFGFLSLMSILVVATAVTYNLTWLIALLMIPYFVWHGYENERSLYWRTTGLVLSPWLAGGIALVVVGATSDAFRHMSATFTATLSYPAAFIPSSAATIATLAPYLFSVGVACMAVGAMMLGFYGYTNRTRAGLWWVTVAVCLFSWFWWSNPLPYVWLFVLLLGYHFVTWALHYGVVFWSNERKFLGYIVGHLVVVGGVLVISLLVRQITDRFPLGLLNSELFLLATVIHISTSFLNDTWLRNRLGLTS